MIKEQSQSPIAAQAEELANFIHHECFHIGAVSEGKIGYGYDTGKAVVAIIAALTAAAAPPEGMVMELRTVKNGIALVCHKFERAGGIFEVAQNGVQLGSMSWASNVQNGLLNAAEAIDRALAVAEAPQEGEWLTDYGRLL